jgi:hypothetical protein
MIAVNNYHRQHKGICLIFSIWHLQGVCRYWTPDIKIFLKELSHAESEKETLLKSTLQRMIGRFCEHHTQWKQLVSATAGTYEPFLKYLLSYSPLYDVCC